MSKHLNAGIIPTYVPMVSTVCFAKLPVCLKSPVISTCNINTVNHSQTQRHTSAHTHTEIHILINLLDVKKLLLSSLLLMSLNRPIPVMCGLLISVMDVVMCGISKPHSKLTVEGVRLNSLIIYTVTQPLHRDRNILLFFSARAIQPVFHPGI